MDRRRTSAAAPARASAADALDAAPSFARLLPPWGVVGAPAAPLLPQLAERLAWADAIALAQVLDAPPAVSAAEPDLPRALEAAEAAMARAQAELLASCHDELLARESAQPLAEGAPPLADLLPPYQLHLSQAQRAMAIRVAALRERLRVVLAAASPELAQLAALDAVLERALAGTERQALAGLAGVVTQRAQAHHRAQARQWPALLWADLQRLLQAERDLRLQPVQGLLQALRLAVAAAVPPSSSHPMS